MQGFGSSITSTASHAAWSTPVRPDGIAVAHTTRLTEGGGAGPLEIGHQKSIFFRCGIPVVTTGGDNSGPVPLTGTLSFLQITKAYPAGAILVDGDHGNVVFLHHHSYAN